MSIGPMGMIGSLAGGQLAQTKGSETERTQQETSAQSRATKNSEKAELAAGVGQTTEDAETSDRDADGRRLWEPVNPADQTDDHEEPDASDQQSPQARDPDGNRGANLDLSG